MRFGRDDVEFAAVGLEKHLRGASGEFEIGEQNAAMDIHNGDAGLRAAHHESDGGIGQGDNFFRVRNDGHFRALLKRGGIVDAQRAGAMIDYQNKFVVGGDAGLHGLRTGFGFADDGASGAVDGNELIVGRGRGEDAVGFGREIERVGQ